MEATRDGDALVAVCAALASPHRLRVLATLAGGRVYVSSLARELGISRPLLHMHLQKLEAAGLVRGEHVVSADGRALRYVELVPFDLHLTPEVVAAAAATMSDAGEPRRREGT